MELSAGAGRGRWTVTIERARLLADHWKRRLQAGSGWGLTGAMDGSPVDHKAVTSDALMHACRLLDRLRLSTCM